MIISFFYSLVTSEKFIISINLMYTTFNMIEDHCFKKYRTVQLNFINYKQLVRIVRKKNMPYNHTLFLY